MKKLLSFGTVALAFSTLFLAGCKQDFDLADIKTDSIKSLSAPSNLTATTKYASILIDWDDVKGAAAYRVVRYAEYDRTGTQLGDETFYTTKSSYFIDSDSALLATKYKYEVTALASTTNDDYVSQDSASERTLYVTDGNSSSVEVTYTYPTNTSTSALKNIAKLNEAKLSIDNDGHAVITLPNVIGLEYEYWLASKTSPYTSNGNYTVISDSNKKTPSKTLTAETDVSTQDTYYLYVKVRIRNTMYGRDYTVVNTGVSAYYNKVSENLKLYCNKMSDGSYMLYVTDKFDDGDSPDNYTYELMSYVLSYDSNGSLKADNENTVASSNYSWDKITLVEDKTNSQWGWRYSVDTPTDNMLYVIKRIYRIYGKPDQISYASATIEHSETDVSFEVHSDAGTATFDETTNKYKRTVSNYFGFNTGSDYTFSKIYRANYDGSEGSSVEINDIISFFGSTITDASTTNEYYTYKENERKSTQYRTSEDSSSLDPSSAKKLYVLELTDKSGAKKLFTYITNVYYYW